MSNFPHHCRRVDVTEYGSVWPERDGKWLISDYLCTGDYVDSYSRSNARVFAREFAAGEGTWWRWARGSIAIRTLAYRNSREVRETLDDLADYPLLDESDHSELEMEDEQEGWESWGRSDFRRELVRVVEAHLSNRELTHDANGFDADEIIDRISDEQVDALFYELCRQEETYTEHSSEGPSFPTVDLANAWAGQGKRNRRGGKSTYRPACSPGLMRTAR
jgi:hypothetical protein